MKKIKIALLGAGENTKVRHIPGLKAMEGVDITAVCNRSFESGKRAADEFGIAEVETDWKKMITRDDIDAVVIGTWPYMHHRGVCKALEAGKHVLCEARMACNATEAREMLTMSKARPELIAQIVPSPFTLEVDATINRMIGEKEIGDTLAVNVYQGGNFIDYDSPMNWRQDFDLSGFNTLMLGIWYEAVLRWMGPASEVCAKSKIFCNTRKTSEGGMKAVEIPEHLDIIADMACGAAMNMQLSAVTGHRKAYEAYIFGSKGTLHFYDGKLYKAGREEKDFSEVKIPEDQKGHWRVEEEFINAIRGKEKIKLTDFETGVKYMEFTEAVWRSFRNGKSIALPLQVI